MGPIATHWGVEMNPRCENRAGIILEVLEGVVGRDKLSEFDGVALTFFAPASLHVASLHVALFLPSTARPSYAKVLL